VDQWEHRRRWRLGHSTRTGDNDAYGAWPCCGRQCPLILTLLCGVVILPLPDDPARPFIRFPLSFPRAGGTAPRSLHKRCAARWALAGFVGLGLPCGADARNTG
jgi:hypothetical protein